MPAPNRHNIVWTVQWPWANNGEPYQDQDIHTTFNTAEAAKAFGEARLAEDPAHFLAYEVHSYFDKFADTPPRWGAVDITPTPSISDMDDDDPTVLR
jgi:hypothetical protein